MLKSSYNEACSTVEILYKKSCHKGLQSLYINDVYSFLDYGLYCAYTRAVWVVQLGRRPQSVVETPLNNQTGSLCS